MTIREALTDAAARLKGLSDVPFLEASVLLAHLSGRDRGAILASYPDPFPQDLTEPYDEMIRRRVSGEPISYITGHREFYGLDLQVDARVLDPRPDTETLVEAALGLMGESGRALDLCTGSGCVALALKSERPDWEITAGDKSSDALEVAALNSRNLNLPVAMVETDLYSGAPGPWDLIATNPPYVSNHEVDGKVYAGYKEPEEALRGGVDGLDLIRKIVSQGVDHLKRGGYLLIEAADFQMDRIEALMKNAGYQEIKIHRDLAGLRRVIRGRTADEDSA